MIKRYSTGFTVFLLISDLLLVVAALFLATQARLILPYGKAIPDSEVLLPPTVYGIAAVIWLTTFVMLNAYSPRNTARLLRELPRIAVAAALGWRVRMGARCLTYRQLCGLQIVYVDVLVTLFRYTQRVAVRGFFRAPGGRSIDSR